MPNFKRYLVPNTAYFVTTTVRDRRPIFVDSGLCAVVLDSLGWCRNEMRFLLLGYVVMPNHLHLILVPSSEIPLPDIMRRFKSHTARAIGERLNSTGGVWQGRYYERALRNESDLRKALDYIHRNPLTAGLVAVPEEYRFSSYGAYQGAPAVALPVDTVWDQGWPNAPVEAVAWQGGSPALRNQ